MSTGVAIVGSGIFVKEEHLPAVQKVPALSLKAVYSRSTASASKVIEGLEGVDIYSDELGETKSYAELLKRSDIHAVIIALPIMTQPAFIEKALQAKKHVLSEKPIAGDIQTAAVLMNWYNTHVADGDLGTWCVAENFRTMDSFDYGRAQVEKLGRVLGFRVKMFAHVKAGGKYFETEWRKKPSHQGGFLLDGGVHFIAGTRLLLGPENAPTMVSAFTSQARDHLPPVDTLDAVWKTKSQVTGTFSVSFGTTLTGNTYVIACEDGVVTVERSTVTVKREGEEKEEKKEFEDEGSGVKREVREWAEGLVTGKMNKRQTPEEAYVDLMMLERMLQSGEQDGKMMHIVCPESL